MRITAERIERGWSRAELARRAGMHPSTVSLIESGRLVPYPSQLDKLAAALGLKSRDDLLATVETSGDPDQRLGVQTGPASRKP